MKKYSKVVGITTLRILLAIAIEKDYIFKIIDISSAYLYAKIDKDIYLKIPEGYGAFPENYALKLNKGLYGLKQAGKLWYEELKDKLVRELKFTQSIFDPGLYYKETSDGSGVYIAVYVDDIKIVTKHQHEIDKFFEHIRTHYDLKLGKEPVELLNMKLVKETDGSITISQRNYTRNIIQKCNMTESKPLKTAMTPGFKPESSKIITYVPYLELVGSIGYLAKTSRPDKSFAYSYLGRFCSMPTEAVWYEAKRVFRYLNGTSHYSLKYTKNDNIDSKLTSYCDASFANCEDTGSTTGYVIFYKGNLIYWKSRKQAVPSSSKTEAELYALINCLKESIYLKEIIQELTKTCRRS